MDGACRPELAFGRVLKRRSVDHRLVSKAICEWRIRSGGALVRELPARKARSEVSDWPLRRYSEVAPKGMEGKVRLVFGFGRERDESKC